MIFFSEISGQFVGVPISCSMKYLKNEKVRILVRFLISRKRFFWMCSLHDFRPYASRVSRVFDFSSRRIFSVADCKTKKGERVLAKIAKKYFAAKENPGMKEKKRRVDKE